MGAGIIKHSVEYSKKLTGQGGEFDFDCEMSRDCQEHSLNALIKKIKAFSG